LLLVFDWMNKFGGRCEPSFCCYFKVAEVVYGVIEIIVRMFCLRGGGGGHDIFPCVKDESVVLVEAEVIVFKS